MLTTQLKTTIYVSYMYMSMKAGSANTLKALKGLHTLKMHAHGTTLNRTRIFGYRLCLYPTPPV